MGAWIETAHLLSCCRSRPVAPLVGAWIETNDLQAQSPKYKGRIQVWMNKSNYNQEEAVLGRVQNATACHEAEGDSRGIFPCAFGNYSLAV